MCLPSKKRSRWSESIETLKRFGRVPYISRIRLNLLSWSSRCARWACSQVRPSDGPAPAPTEYRVISRVHTDAISTFLDDGQLQLGAKVDVDEQFGVRFAAEQIWLHLEEEARTLVPADREFIAPIGSEVWIADEVNPGPGRLWPGFSTESVPADAVTGDTTLRLTEVDGPGQVELFTVQLGAVRRLWSSRDAAHRAFALPPGTHRHANWAFTATGSYRIAVEATATVNGQPQSAQATYTFVVVGDVPAAVSTTTALTASASTIAAGRALTLDATVTPSAAAGAVEFRDGGAVLGHAAVEDGSATLPVALSRLGTRSLTAHFVPAVANRFGVSASDPVNVSVVENDGAEPFGIVGVETTYQPGEIIELRLTGATLEPGQTTLWRM